MNKNIFYYIENYIKSINDIISEIEDNDDRIFYICPHYHYLDNLKVKISIYQESTSDRILYIKTLNYEIEIENSELNKEIADKLMAKLKLIDKEGVTP